MSDTTTWTYHVVFGADVTDPETKRTTRDSVMEVGPFPTVAEALAFSASSMGRRAVDVDGDVTDWLIDEGPAAAPSAEWRVMDPATLADARLDGYTIERYDGEQTDGSWSLNGGLRATIREAAAA